MATLVTGGCGFIGSHLVAQLVRSGERVLVVDDLSTGKRENLPPGVELAEADIVHPACFSPLLPVVDRVFHLAAIASVERSNRDWYRTHQVNIGGTVNLFHSIARSGRSIPVVYASSAAVYGDCPTLPIAETMPVAPLSAYGADKLACEQHAAVATELHGIPTAGLRFFNVYGPNQDAASPYSGVISIFMQKAAERQPLTILGDGEQTRDFVYVEDVVSTLLAAMEKLQTGALRRDVFNVGTGNAISIRKLAETINRIAGNDAPIQYGPARAGEIRHSYCANSHAATLLGYQPSCPLETGLQLTYGAVTA